jgi:hypothetical protein
MSRFNRRATIIALFAGMLAVLGILGINLLAPGSGQKVASESNTPTVDEIQSCEADCSLYGKDLEGCTLSILVNNLGPPEKLSMGLAPSYGPENVRYLAVFMYPSKGVDFSTGDYDSNNTADMSTYPNTPVGSMVIKTYTCYQPTTAEEHLRRIVLPNITDWKGIGR